MPFHLLRPALLASVLLTVAVPSAAWALDAALREPDDAVVTGATRVIVRVATAADERPERIEATLHHPDGELGPEARHLLCEGPPTCGRDRADYAIEFDPRTGAPFLAADTAQILANGDYVIRIVAAGADETTVRTVDLPLTLSAPGTAPADVRAVAQGDGEVLLSWDPAPEPDVSGYLVERATGNGWTLVADIPEQAVSLTDAPGDGVHAYRVVTLRPDGRGATYETVSREVSVVVAASDDPPVTDDETPEDAVEAASEPATEPSTNATSAPADAAPEAADGATSGDGGGDDDREPATAPAPGPSATTRTVSEDGDLVIDASASAPHEAERSGRPVAPLVVGLIVIALAVRVWRRGRPVHRPPVS